MEVLKLYGVHRDVIKLRDDPNTGKEAVVYEWKCGGVEAGVGRSHTVKANVRQGCVITSMLFHVFVNHTLHDALSQLPFDKQFGVQIITKPGSALLKDLTTGWLTHLLIQS
eukprot:366141-Chlamydomonas_euryale.AAC.2